MNSLEPIDINKMYHFLFELRDRDETRDGVKRALCDAMNKCIDSLRTCPVFIDDSEEGIQIRVKNAQLAHKVAIELLEEAKNAWRNADAKPAKGDE